MPILLVKKGFFHFTGVAARCFNPKERVRQFQKTNYVVKFVSEFSSFFSKKLQKSCRLFELVGGKSKHTGAAN